jgi:hypothetical protein
MSQANNEEMKMRYGKTIELDDVEVTSITVSVSFDDIRDEVLENLDESDIRELVSSSDLQAEIAEQYLSGMNEEDQLEWFENTTGIDASSIGKFDVPSIEIRSVIEGRVVEIRNESTRQLLGVLLPRTDGGALLRMFDHDPDRDTGWVSYDTIAKAHKIAKLLVYGFYVEANVPSESVDTDVVS